jgi:NAD+ kinase
VATVFRLIEAVIRKKIPNFAAINQTLSVMTSLRFALFGNLYQHHKSAAIKQLLTALRSRGAHICIDEEYYDFLRCSELIDMDETVTFAGSDFEADFAVSMGGDGTLLKTASRVGLKQTPIVGVNMGRLGFLADVGANDIEQTVEALYRGDYSVEDRSLIHVETNGEPLEGCPSALNDVAILKRDSASMISIRATINGEYLTTYQADGLIVSTPTGSTAYSLSNGGPIIVPRTGVLLMTAVAPHSLNVRPIVLPDTAQIELTVSSRSHTFLVAIDGRSGKLPEGTTLRLTRAPYVARVVKRSGTRYFATLREKMMWGVDAR